MGFSLRAYARHALERALVGWFTRLHKTSVLVGALDIYFAYRLILGRIPKAEELSFWQQAAERGMTANQLAKSFLDSAEARQRWQMPKLSLVRTPDFSLWVGGDFLISDAIAAHGQYEPGVTAVMRGLLREDSVVVDVGANLGWFTLLAASIARHGRVISVEPSPYNVQLLCRNLQLNGFVHVVVLPIAAGERWQLARLGGGQALTRVDYNPDAVGDFVSVAPLDDVLCGADVDVIKIDVDGDEPFVLAGLKRTLHAGRPAVVMEFSPQAYRERGLPPTAHLDWLSDMGYALFIITSAGDYIPCPTGIQALERWHALGDEGAHLDLLALPSERIPW